MADQVTISTFLELRDHLSGGVNKVVEELQRLNRTVDEMNGKMKSAGDAHRRFERAAVVSAGNSKSALEGLRNVANSLASPLLAAASAIGGFSALKGAIKLGQDFEDVGIRIAGTIRAFDLAPTFTVAAKQAESVMGTIQSLAAALPGEVDDYITVFAQALPKSIAAGMRDMQKVADFTSRYTAVAISNTVDAQQAGMDLFRMLAGQAGADVRMWTVLAEQIGMDAKEFNKLSASVRQSKIDAAIKAFDDQLKAAGNTFSAKFGEMQSTLKEIVRLGSAQLFAGVKGVLVDINKYLVENKEQLIATVRVISRDFLDIVRRFPSIMDEIGKRLSEIWDYSKLIVGIWAGAQLLNGLSGALAIYKQIKDVVVAINAAGAVGAATSLAGAGGGAAMASAAAKLSVGQIMVVGATTVVLAAGVAKMFAESVGEFAKAGAGMRAGRWGTADWEKEQFRTGRTSAQTIGRAISEIDQKTQYAAREALVFQGKYTDLQEQLSKARFGAIASYERQEGVAGLITELDALQAMYKQALVSPIKSAKEDVVKFAESMGVSLASLTEAPRRDFSTQAAPKAAPKEKPKSPVVNFNNNRFDIKQEFAEGFDPDRIAVAFANDLGRMGDMKLGAAYGVAAGR